MLSKLGGMVVYGTLQVVLKPPRNYATGVNNPIMARKEDIFTVVDFFEINALNHWCNTPCVTKTQRYGYIWEYASCAEPSHRTTIGCEKRSEIRTFAACKQTKTYCPIELSLAT